MTDIEDAPGDAATPTATVSTITVHGPGVSIERPVDEATMASVIAILFGAAPAAPSGAGGGQGVRRPDPKPGNNGSSSTSPFDDDLTLGEFIVESKAGTFRQKICAAGYFLTNMHGAPSFSSAEIKTALANAHEDMPANFTRDFSSAASNHLIAPKQGEASQYIIPRTGRTAVESLFQDVPKRRVKKSVKKAASSGDSE